MYIFRQAIEKSLNPILKKKFKFDLPEFLIVLFLLLFVLLLIQDHQFLLKEFMRA